MSKSFSKISKIISLLSALNLGLVPSIVATSNVSDNLAVDGSFDQSSNEKSSVELLPVMPVVDNSSESVVNEKSNLEVPNAESVQVNSDLNSGDLGGTYANRILGNNASASVSDQSPDYLEKYLYNQSWSDISTSILMGMFALGNGVNAVKTGLKMYDDYSKGEPLSDIAKERALSWICQAGVSAMSAFLACKSFRAGMDADTLRSAYSIFKSSPVAFDESNVDVTSQLNSGSVDTKNVSAPVDSSSVNAQPDASMAMKILV